jgi:hypothetical protein
VIGPERVAEHIAAVIGSNRVETYVPGWYRAAAIVQTLVPGALARLLAAR